MNDGAPFEIPQELFDSDVANASRFANKFCAGVRYTPERGWLIWGDARWEIDDGGFVMELAKDAARLIFDEVKMSAREQQKAVFSWARQSQRAERLRAMLFLAQSEPGISARWKEFDADPWLLACSNGTVDLRRTGTLRPADRRDKLSRLVPIDFDPEAACSAWDRFLERVLPDPDVRGFLQRAIGYSLTGSTAEQCLFFLYGCGANGKSILIEVLSALLGEHAVAASFDSFSGNAGGIPNDIARLAGARLVTVSEVEDGARLREVLIKDLTGGDTITARFLHREFFDFRPNFKLWVRGNHKPQIRGTDEGIWRRIRLIELPVQIPEAERDPRLFEKLRSQLPGILAWAVRGCLEWQRVGLSPPRAVKEATRAYREEQDVIGGFLTECCVVDQRATVPASELYRDYSKWADEAGHHALSQTRFGMAMSERGIQRERTRTAWIYRGIGLGVIGMMGCDTNSGSSPTRAHIKGNRGNRDHTDHTDHTHNGSADAEATIRAWLASIGETDPETIADALESCRRDPAIMAAYLASASEPAPC